MAIKNATTGIDVMKTVGEVHAVLVRRGVSHIGTSFDKTSGRIIGVEFTMETEYGPRNFQLPVRTAGVLKALERDKNVRPGMKTPEQAERVAWRIALEWLQVQGALIDAEMATVSEVFLPYMLVAPHTTAFESYVQGQKELELGERNTR